jgi:hypothetical protein
VGGPFGLRLPTGYGALARLARIDHEHIASVEQEDGYTVTRKDIIYPGLTLGVAVPGNRPDGYLVSGADVRSARWRSLSPFGVGQSVRAVRGTLGQPAAGDRSLRRAYGNETSSVSFKVSNGRITEVHYQCYTG